MAPSLNASEIGSKILMAMGIVSSSQIKGESTGGRPRTRGRQSPYPTSADH